MIETIEIAPDILAASLAKYLKEKNETSDYFAYAGYEQDVQINERALRALIRDFLTTPLL